MTKTEFAGFIREHGPVILDGATGTNLMEAGMPIGVCPESWVLENPQVLLDLQRRYVEAGSHIVYASTFTGNRIKLEEYGLQERLEEINTQLVALSRQAVGDQALVAGDMTMTGQQLFPMGELLFEELVEVYKEQASVLAKAGVDLFVVETMMSLQECRAAVIAIREVCDLPIMVTLTYNEDGRTLFGTPPETAVVVLQSLGVDAIGVNCSTGPMEMVPLVERMAEYATIPLIAKPNAGLPELEGKKTVYRMTPEEFAGAGVALVKAGAAIVGGCCGTTEKHIKALSDATRGMELHRPLASHRRILASERKNVEVGLDGNFLVVGERINPTGKKKLQAQLREGKLDLVREMAMAQEENGAAILDINMGMNGIDEKEMMKQVIYEVAATVDCPLCLDTSHIDVMEEALRVYPGRALINSVSLETEKSSICFRWQKSTGLCLSCFRFPMRDCQRMPKKSMRLSIPYMTVPWSWEWHTRILSWMGWLPQSEPIQRLRKNVMIPSLIVRISGSFQRSVVCRIFRLACRSGVLSIRHFLPWPSAGGLPWRLPIRRRNF